MQQQETSPCPMSERVWGEAVMSDWAAHGQCTQPALVGKCGAQAVVLDLSRAANGWEGVAGNVEFYEFKAGSPEPDDSMFPWGKHTMYELGSTTKAFTTVLTQLLVDQGHLNWDEPVSAFFPNAKFRDARVANLTLDLMSTHTSGLPARPFNLPSKHPAFEPYANFTQAQLLHFFDTLDLSHSGATPKGEFIYCNDGFGLMGAALEQRMGLRCEPESR